MVRLQQSELSILGPGPVVVLMRLAKLILVMLLGLLFGCDAQRIEKLEEGVSTEADVRRQFGEPASVTLHADGSKSLEYPRQPEGWTNYEIGIGADGKMSSLRQLLTEANFARVSAGMDTLQVQALLGRPAERKRYALKDEEVWTWRYKPVNESRLFSVSFDAGGRVLRTASSIDPRDVEAGGK
jgi:hypothetical protein